jgi:hypothetical protein
MFLQKILRFEIRGTKNEFLTLVMRHPICTRKLINFGNFECTGH